MRKYMVSALQYNCYLTIFMKKHISAIGVSGCAEDILLWRGGVRRKGVVPIMTQPHVLIKDYATFKVAYG